MPRGRPPVCPHFSSNRSQKKGKRKMKTAGLRQIRLCKDWGRKFTPKHQKTVEPEQQNEPDDSICL